MTSLKIVWPPSEVYVPDQPVYGGAAECLSLRICARALILVVIIRVRRSRSESNKILSIPPGDKLAR